LKAIPTLDEISPRIAALRAKRAEKYMAIPPLIMKCEEMRARLRSGALPDMGNDKENRVRAILGEELLPTKPSDVEGLRQTLADLEIVKSVVSMLDAEIIKEEQAASSKLTEAVRAEINRLGSEFASAYRELHTAALKYVKLISDVEDAGGNVSALRLTPGGLGNPRDPNSEYRRGLDEFISANFFKKSDLPKVLVQ
jgi:hypothetical protein